MRERVRRVILEQDKRIDDRSSTDIRPISAQVQVLPRTHGSAIFTRGETQALATVTLGTSSDEQKIDALWASATRNSCCTITSRRSRPAK